MSDLYNKVCEQFLAIFVNQFLKHFIINTLKQIQSKQQNNEQLYTYHPASTVVNILPFLCHPRMTQGILIPYLIIIFSNKHFPLLLFQVSESVQLKSNQNNVVTICNYLSLLIRISSVLLNLNKLQKCFGYGSLYKTAIIIYKS